jgi:hypothetical protein
MIDWTDCHCRYFGLLHQKASTMPTRSADSGKTPIVSRTWHASDFAASGGDRLAAACPV